MMETGKFLTRNNILMAVAVAIVLLGGAAGYYFWQGRAAPAPKPVQAPPPPPPPPKVEESKPVVESQVSEAAPPAPPLPQLAESDGLVLDALAGLVGDKSLMRVFRNERFVRNFVATIDNLPRRRAPMRVMPVRAAPGEFIAAGGENNLVIAAQNAARYSAYVRIAGAIDAKQLVGLYLRLYPLFQQAYEELGYPKKYFNDRLVEALDDLLAAPDVKEAVGLVHPEAFYLYADADLEGRSIGQRILARTGSNNEAKLKARLREIRQELQRHMQGGKLTFAN